MTRVLVTCPPMLRSLDQLMPEMKALGWQVEAPKVTQTLTEQELRGLVPSVDAWIAGDDPVNRSVMAAGKQGRLRVVVKWGVGVDNVDFAAAKDLGIPVRNTPGVFGDEVADLALGYVLALARDTFAIDRAVRAGQWPKPVGVSLRGKRALVAGFGNIGKEVARRLVAIGMQVDVHDPFFQPAPGLEVRRVTWPDAIREADTIVLTCPLTKETFHMLDGKALALAKRGVRIVNVARGPLIDENALVDSLKAGVVHGAALDVFEEEPLPRTSPLHHFERCIFGSHNASNTLEAALRASRVAIRHVEELLAGVKGP